MPSQRRTRAMGHSPGGPKALDINAPTRQPRKGKASATAEDAPTPAARTTRARPGPKRKNEDLIAEEPSAKRFRLNKADGNSETVASGSRPLIPSADSESTQLPEFASSSQQEDPALKPEQDTEPRVNAQQPTPPLDSPVDASTEQPSTNAPQSNTQEDTSLANAQRRIDKKNKNEKRISDMIRHYHTIRQEVEDDDEKALSECDDDEWEKRYSSVMEEARNPKPFIATSKGEWEKWADGSTAMFVVREPKRDDLVAGKKNGPRMPLLTFTTASRLPALGARPVTKIDTIVAISASLDWYEKNPTIAAPSAAEMNVMLDNFARAKQAPQVQAANPTFTQNPQNRASDTALTNIAQVTGEDLAEAPPSNFDDSHSTTDDHEEPGMDQNGDYSADVETNIVEAAVPQTPQHNQAPEGPRTWASALSASAIGNVILTPLNSWFTRRDRQRRDIAATEPRPAKAKPDLTRPAQAHQKSRSQDTPVQPSKILLAKNNSLPSLENTLAPDSPTPAASQPRRGRPDSHLPVHLRGVMFEDLPLEWQAVSQHLKKPRQVQIEDKEVEEVDMNYILATAKRTRKERDRKELQEQAELIAQKQRDLESDDEISGDHIHGKGKKRVTFSPEKTYSAKLGHSTFGMPANIDETSSDEDREPLRPRTHFGRNSRPLKSCLKRNYQQPTCEDYVEKENAEDGYEQRPAKKARLDERASSQSSDVSDSNEDIPSRGEGSESFLYDDDPHRARPPSHFISKPPSELRRAEVAQMEFEKLNPRNRSQGTQAEIGRTSGLRKNSNNNPNLFASGGRNAAQDWLSLFQSPARRHTASTRWHDSPLRKYEGGFNRRRLFSSSARDKNGRLIRTTPALQEAKQARLNQQRDDKIEREAEEARLNQQVDDAMKQETDEARLNQQRDDATKHKQEAEGVRLNQQRDDTMKHKPDESTDLQVARKSLPIQETPSFGNLVLDEEVLKAIALLDDDEILAEGFGKYPNHAEATVSTEASKAIEYPALLGRAAEEREAGTAEEATKAIEYPAWFDRAAAQA